MVKLTGPKKIKTAVFISGTGSNLKNIIIFSLSSACLILLMSILVGCDTNDKPVFPVYPVKGTVKYADGKPLTDGWIEFTSMAGETKGRNSNSKIDKDGNFEMETFG